jgi:exodeoxyribonuclease-1
MALTFLFHDYETFGADPKRDRPAQFAAIRTDENFNEIGEPMMIYTRMQEDTLPSPTACMITKITPSEVNEKGISEYDFIKMINKEMSVPSTCSLGYNTIQFDDEVTRNTLYRNMMDPYEREYKSGCSRWDMIDVIRLAVALKPGIIKLGERDGKVSYKLEDLSKENGILHEAAHDALSDVRATIGIAKLIRERAPELFDKLLAQRNKKELSKELLCGKPILQASALFGSDTKYVDFILPITTDPINKNKEYCIRLSRPVEELQQILDEDAEEVKKRLYSSKADLELRDETRPALHAVTVNKCPALVSSDFIISMYPDNDSRNKMYEDIGLKLPEVIKAYKFVKENKEAFAKKILEIYHDEEFLEKYKLEQDKLDYDIQIYNGFASEKDRKKMFFFHKDLEKGMIKGHINGGYDDSKRYNEIVYRLVARSFPDLFDKLPAVDKEKWHNHCKERLFNKKGDSVTYSFDEFFAEIEELRMNEKYQDRSYQDVLHELEVYGNDLKRKFS